MHMSKKPGKLLMKLFLQKQKKIKLGTETYNTDLNNQNHCEELNINFSKIRKDISSKIDPPPSTFNDFLIESFPNLCTFPPTSADEIRQIIASLKCKTTSNFYDIPAKFSKFLPVVYPHGYLKFFLNVWQKVNFPLWKKFHRLHPFLK